MRFEDGVKIIGCVLLGAVLAISMSVFASYDGARHVMGTGLVADASGDYYLNGGKLCLDAACDEYMQSDGTQIIFAVGGVGNAYFRTSNAQFSTGVSVNSQELYGVGWVGHAFDTIAADDATPNVSTGVIFFTSDNSAPTAITDLDSPTAGQTLWICIGGTGANASTIADGGNFNLSAAWSPGLDDCIHLLVHADNDYVELSRVDN